MKGQEWYQAETIAEAYEDKRFSGGGRLIDRREKQAVLDAIVPREGQRVLEIACGTGRFTVLLAEHGANVTGIDISDAMLSQGRVKAKAAAVEDRLDFIRGDAGRLPFPNDSFNAVFAVRFFHLTDTPRRFLREMRRVASDRVFFDTFNAVSARSAYNWLLPMGSRLYNRDDVHELIDAVGLELVEASHDFVLPYGLYRSIPDSVARPLRAVDTAAMGTHLGQRLASVSYWTCRAKNQSTSADRT